MERQENKRPRIEEDDSQVDPGIEEEADPDVWNVTFTATERKSLIATFLVLLNVYKHTNDHTFFAGLPSQKLKRILLFLGLESQDGMYDIARQGLRAALFDQLSLTPKEQEVLQLDDEFGDLDLLSEEEIYGMYGGDIEDLEDDE